MHDEETGTLQEDLAKLADATHMPAVLLAYAPKYAAPMDRCPVKGFLSVGRDKACTFTIQDRMLSREHFQIEESGDGFTVEDMGSKNGTFLNGKQIAWKTPLYHQAVIRAGQVVMVFSADASDMFDVAKGQTSSVAKPMEDRLRSAPTVANRTLRDCGLIGKFHAPTVIGELAECALSDRPLLITGPTGSGKELAVNAIAEFLQKPIFAHNAARFTSEDEATATLFGVEKGVFSNVDASAGLIEQADGGILFLDEAHVLPGRVQKSLLRVIEESKFSRFGEKKQRQAKVRFVFASNEPPPTYGLEHDLLARTRVVTIPPLQDRRADIPGIFDHVLHKALERVKVNPAFVRSLLSTYHYEQLILDGFAETNVRGLVDLADKVATGIAFGTKPQQVVCDVFLKRYHQNIAPLPTAAKDADPSLTTHPAPQTEQPYSLSTKGTRAIQAAYEQHAGNVSAIEKELRKNGFTYSRRTIAKYLDIMKLPRVKRGRK
jgi:transcriptional regulator with AAA-type ATPase domain